jgi:hypothetical protein
MTPAAHQLHSAGLLTCAPPPVFFSLVASPGGGGGWAFNPLTRLCGISLWPHGCFPLAYGAGWSFFSMSSCTQNLRACVGALLAFNVISDPDFGFGVDPGRLRGYPLAHLTGTWR